MLAGNMSSAVSTAGQAAMTPWSWQASCTGMDGRCAAHRWELLEHSDQHSAY
jgi:hypothetical protein